MWGWREAFNAPANTLQKLDTSSGLPLQAFLGVAGMPGMTAYAGLLRVGGLKDGDVVFVSAAAGAVGSVVCQIAKIKGHTVIGSAGGPEKAAFLKSIGVDHVIDYKAVPDLKAALREAAPKGIDVYFENVGGEHLEAAIDSARPFARFALCGMISQYNETGEPKGPSNIIQAVGKSLKLEGFIVSNHYDMLPDFLRDMSAWIGSGQLQWKDTVDEGIDNAAGAFIKLFKGENMGKMLVKLV
jgi:NADPH-dependent curcumin reductase CurA